mgnify:CR=1 FL=1
MKEYTSNKIRSIGIVGHSGSGKTSVAEAILFRAGVTTRMGRTDDGTTVTDYEPEETKRKVTISTALAPIEWKDTKMNFLDTPGYADFVAELKGALRAVDSALVVVCATAGVEVGTEKAWQYAEDLELPRMIVVNKMDRENADFDKIVDTMKERFSNRVIPLQIPIGSESNFKGIVDIVTMKAYIANGNVYEEAEIPEDLMDMATLSRDAIIEAAAEANDEMLMKFFDGEELTEEEMMFGLVDGVKNARIFPVFCCSTTKNIGVGRLLDSIMNYTPSAAEKKVEMTHRMTGEKEAVTADTPLSALVFKTTTDPFVGRLSFIKVFSGKISADSTIYNMTKDKTERVASVFTMRGKTQILMPAIVAGDIGVVAKLQETETGDTICMKDRPFEFDPIDFPKPMHVMAIEAKNKNDEDKIGNAIARIMDEDPTFVLKRRPDSKEKLVSGIGDQHLDIILEKMKRKFGVEAILKVPTISYRETIKGTSEVEAKHKKQSGGSGQYGHVKVKMEPLPNGTGYEFVDAVFGGAVPRQYIPAVDKGMQESMLTGVLAGFPAVDIKVTLLDGSYHAVDSSEMAFKIASHMAFKKGCLEARPIILEPIYNVQVYVPESFMGDIMGDFNSRRGRVSGMMPVGKGIGEVTAQVPHSEMLNYAIELRAMTQGRGWFDMTFDHYEEVPARIAEEIIKKHAKNKED